jgi:excisionase family DNA binding protein
LNLRPLGPEPDAGLVHRLAAVRPYSQPLDSTRVVNVSPVENLPRDPPDGVRGNRSNDAVAAELRHPRLLRPELLISVAYVAERLGVSVATVHNAINAGKLRCHLFGSVRRIKPEDVELYIRTYGRRRPRAARRVGAAK